MIHTKISDEPIGKEYGETPAVFDVITTYWTPETQRTRADDAEASGRTPLTTESEGRQSIKIYSVAVINAIQSVVKYYPPQNLSGSAVKVDYPYAILVHHRHELEEFRQRCDPDSPDWGDHCEKEDDAFEHLGLLLDFLNRNVMPLVHAEEERYTRGMATFNMLWLLFRPGDDVLEHSHDSQCLWRLQSGVVSMYSKADINLNSCVEVEFWRLVFHDEFLVRRPRKRDVEIFDGEKPIEKLEVVPLKHMKKSINGDSIFDHIVKRGKRYRDLTFGKCMQYNSVTSTDNHLRIDGLIMTDMKAYELYVQPDFYANYGPRMTSGEGLRAFVTTCECRHCRSRKVSGTKARYSQFSNYDYIRNDNFGALTDHQLSILPFSQMCFIFNTRNWELLYVEDMQEPDFKPNMIESLVMPPGRVRLLKALAKSFIREDKSGKSTEQKAWGADLVPGKGKSQIFLLHGKPGVGKTFTAECIAQFTKRPLMMLSTSDIGTDPAQAETKLLDKFQLAKRWDAILLIDEADVYMQSRSNADLHRNTLVAAFLRALEFYDGILFLTTNRVGSFDDAFISRIHVKLFYADFTDEDRLKIWHTFIKKLDDERGDMMRVHGSAMEYIEGKEVTGLKMNGREIRNAFQTAVALAEYEAEKGRDGLVLLKIEHLKEIIHISKHFKEYLKKLHMGDESKRAQRDFSRLDEYEEGGR